MIHILNCLEVLDNIFLKTTYVIFRIILFAVFFGLSFFVETLL